MNLNIKLASIAFYGMPVNGQTVTAGEAVYQFWLDGQFPEPDGRVLNLLVHDTPDKIADALAERISIDVSLTQCKGVSKNGILILSTTEDGINISSDADNCIVANFD